MISRSSNTTPGVLALTDNPSTGDQVRAQVHPPVGAERRDLLARAPVECVQAIAVVEDHAITVTTTPMTDARQRGRAVVGIEAPQLLARRRVEREHVHLGRRGVQDAVDHDRIGLHLRPVELVVRLVRPGHFQARHVGRRDLAERRVVSVVGVAAVHGPVGGAGLGGEWRRQRQDARSQRGKEISASEHPAMLRPGTSGATAPCERDNDHGKLTITQRVDLCDCTQEEGPGRGSRNRHASDHIGQHLQGDMLELMDDLAERHAELVVTKHGRPMVKIGPVEDTSPSPIGFLRGIVIVHEISCRPTCRVGDVGQ